MTSFYRGICRVSFPFFPHWETLYFCQIIFSEIKMKSPSDGVNARGVALSNKKQVNRPLIFTQQMRLLLGFT